VSPVTDEPSDDLKSFWWTGEMEHPGDFVEPRGHFLGLASDIETMLAELVAVYFGFDHPHEKYGELVALLSYDVTFEGKCRMVPKVIAAVSDDELRQHLSTKPKLVTRLDELRDRRNWLAHGLIALHLGQSEPGGPPQTVVRTPKKGADWHDEQLTQEKVRGWLNDGYAIQGDLARVLADLHGYRRT
jgi:hypothetical protein